MHLQNDSSKMIPASDVAATRQTKQYLYPGRKSAMARLPYQDPSQPLESRVNDLLARMTLAEKCAQMIGPFGLNEPEGTFRRSLPVSASRTAFAM